MPSKDVGGRFVGALAAAINVRRGEHLINGLFEFSSFVRARDRRAYSFGNRRDAPTKSSIP